MKRRSRWWRAAAETSVALLLGTTAACTTPGEPSLGELSDSTDGANSWSVSMRDTAINDSYSFGAINLCIREGGSVQIVKVVPEQATGEPVVRAFAVREVPTPDSGLFGDSKGTLEELGRGIGSDGEAKGFDPAAQQLVTGPCSREQGQSELAVEIARPTPATAVVDKLAVTYASSDPSKTSRTRVFVVPSTFILCAKSDPRTECRG